MEQPATPPPVNGPAPWKDDALFTPGPLTTSRTVKQAMLRDLGSRDAAFLAIVRDVRARLVALAQAEEGDYAAVPMQGSGTFGLEAVLGSCIPPHGVLLVAVNGAYGRRLVAIADRLGIETAELEYDDDEVVRPGDVTAALRDTPGITHVAVCHCETTSGLLNPVEDIGAAVADAEKLYIVDGMSSFGAIPLDVPGARIDYLVSSANKCIEGVPGFSFVIARRKALAGTRDWARSVSLDLGAQLEGLERNGQFRFTPPTHALLAFHQALVELEDEGGVAGRNRRYAANHAALVAGMDRLGFRRYLNDTHQGPIITSFHYPGDDRFDFEEFYRRLKARGMVIYPGKVGKADCFRIGTVGRLFPSDVAALLAAVEGVTAEMGFNTRPSREICTT